MSAILVTLHKRRGVLLPSWRSETASKTVVADVPHVEDYVPGEFYRRELPCIEALLRKVSESIDCIVIDANVTLGSNAAPGLGAKLWQALHGRVPVVGVAKSGYPGVPEETKVYRGGSKKPLYVTAAGMSLDEAKVHIVEMSGEHRLPAMLKLADRISRLGSL